MTTILRHQQQQAMIGQRMDLLRLHQLAASIEQQQQHGHLLAITMPGQAQNHQNYQRTDHSQFCNNTMQKCLQIHHALFSHKELTL